MGDKPFLGLVAPFVPAVGWIRAYKAKEFPGTLSPACRSRRS